MTLIKHPDSGFPDSLPLLTPMAGEATPDDLPTLTDIVSEAVPRLHPALSEKEQQRLLQHLENHVVTVFARKLTLRLEQLQHQTVSQAISELKTELPGLLRDELKTYLESR